MNRALVWAFAPEVLMAGLTALVFLYCARHGSYTTNDVRALERLVWTVPVVAVSLAYAPILLAEARSWSWLLRINLAVVIALVVCAGRIVSGFGAPGSGPSGQDAGFIVMITLGAALSAVAGAVAAALILSGQKPVVAEWMRTHALLGSLATAVAVLPLFIAQATMAGVVAGLASTVVTLVKR